MDNDMSITSAQCRAARGLLAWSQDTLAINARISRATVNDFENNMRRPMTNNMLSIIACMSAAGIEFLDEKNGIGAGVRFREQKLEHNRKIKITMEGVSIQMIFDGKEFSCIVPREVLEDLTHGNFREDAQYQKAVEENLHHILEAAERECKNEFSGFRLILNHDKFDEALFN